MTDTELPAGIDWRDLFRRYVMAVVGNEGVSFVEDIRPMSAEERKALIVMLEQLGYQRTRGRGPYLSTLDHLDEG